MLLSWWHYRVLISSHSSLYVFVSHLVFWCILIRYNVFACLDLRKLRRSVNLILWRDHFLFCWVLYSIFILVRVSISSFSLSLSFVLLLFSNLIYNCMLITLSLLYLLVLILLFIVVNLFKASLINQCLFTMSYLIINIFDSISWIGRSLWYLINVHFLSVWLNSVSDFWSLIFLLFLIVHSIIYLLIILLLFWNRWSFIFICYLLIF